MTIRQTQNLGTGTVFLAGVAFGFIGGFFVLTSLGRRMVVRGAEVAGERVERKLEV